MFVEQERKYVRWLQRNKIITDPFKTHKLQERYGKNIFEKRGMLINWRGKKGGKKGRDNIEFERTKTLKQDFSLKSNSYCSREKGLSFIQSWPTGALQIISIKA